MTSIRIELGARSYEVRIGAGTLAQLGEALVPLLDAECARIALVSDRHVRPLFAESALKALERTGRRLSVHELPPGEEAKELGAFGRLQAELIAAGLDRSSYLIALGGGAVGDAVGFAAATFMRGIRFAQVPTTLLAMVDASVGGKTAINLPAGKNLVGAFHQPILVLADLHCLGTLPERELRAGLGEVVKYGLMADPTFFEQLELTPDPHAMDLEAVVGRSIRIKASFVAADEREAGTRRHLNLGHTFAHGIEAASGFSRYLHGEAVALGLIAACRLAEMLVGLDPSVTRRTRDLLAAMGLPLRTDVDPSAVRSHMATDKKKLGAGLRFVLPRELGSVVVLDNVPEEAIKEALAAIG
ncbi:MAG: 3-dehydroquinate synthase [Planctomycetota bacterium]